MNAIKRLGDTLYIAFVVAAKDVTDALKNRKTLVNIIATLAILVFFDFMLTSRPYDKTIDVLVYDAGGSAEAVASARLSEATRLSDGSEVVPRMAESLEQLQRDLGYKALGLVLPADFTQKLAAAGEPVLTGYVNWSQRARVAELEGIYSRQVSEWLGQPVQVVIGENVVQPGYDTIGGQTSAATYLFFAIFYMAVLVVPFLMIEEKHARTLDALQVSPVSGAQLVLGKALAGLFYVVLAAGLAFWLNRIYVIHWDLAILAALCSAVFSILLALAVGSLLNSPQQMTTWALVVMLVFLVPAWFVHEPNLVPALRAILGWIPSAALATLFRFACSVGAPRSLLLQNLAIVLAYVVLLYGFMIWQMRRADR